MNLILLLVLLVLILAAFGGSGYGYYSGGAYASPMGILGAVLIVALLVWLLFGGTAVWVTPAPVP